MRVKRLREAGGAVLEESETVPGEADKRLFLKEEEFSRVLRIARKQGTTISATLREAWDSDLLMTTAKKAPETATGAHVVILGHITPEELLRGISETELSGGFVNRFLLVSSRRSKRLVRPPRVPEAVQARLIEELRAVQSHVLALPEAEAEVGLSGEAWDLWDAVKAEIEEGIERADAAGLVLARLITRGEPYVLRLSALYAVLDRKRTIAPVHLRAAREIWRYSVDSARAIFEERIGDRDAETIVEALRTSSDGRLSRSAISGLFGRNRTTKELDRLRDLLIAADRIAAYRERTGRPHRPAEWWCVRSPGAPLRPPPGATARIVPSPAPGPPVPPSLA